MLKKNPAGEQGLKSQAAALLEGYSIIGNRIIGKISRKEYLLEDEGLDLAAVLRGFPELADTKLVTELQGEPFRKRLREANQKLEEESERYEFGTFPPCCVCWRSNVKTTKMFCSHSVCRWCLRDRYFNMKSNPNILLMKCPSPECYHIITPEEFRDASDLPEGWASSESRKQEDTSMCPLCGKTACLSPRFPCGSGHGLCVDCFREYLEYHTHGEVLVKLSPQGGDKDEYMSVPCPFPGCGVSIDLEAYGSICYTGAEWQQFKDLADERSKMAAM